MAFINLIRMLSATEEFPISNRESYENEMREVTSNMLRKHVSLALYFSRHFRTHRMIHNDSSDVTDPWWDN